MEQIIRKLDSFKALREEKVRQQKADRKAMAEKKVSQDDLSLFRGMDLSKVKVIFP